MKTGIDIGYYATKLWNGRKTSFLSVTGTPDESRFRLYGGGADIIKLDDGSEWFYGKNAVEQSRMLQRREDRNWIESPEYYRLFISALSLIVSSSNEDVDLVTGLPIAYYDDKEKLSSMLLATHRFYKNDVAFTATIKNLRIVPQPFGAVLNEALDDNGAVSDAELASGKIGVIDIGGKTTNILVSEKMAEKVRQTTSVNIGGWDVARQISQTLIKKFPELELRDHEVIDTVKSGHVKYFGESIDISETVAQIIRPLATTIIGEATQLWNGGASLDKIFVVGGGSYLIYPYISAQFKHAITPQDAEFANVLGYKKLAQRIS